MMQEIKFRAWDKATKNGWIPKPIKEMIYFNILHPPEYLGNTYDEEGTWERRFAIMQYTGLKDKTGNEIYQGDIVNYKTFSNNENYVITIKPTVLQMINTSKYKPSFMYSLESFFEDYDGGMKSNNNVEVIGNIYENPELLEHAQ